MRVVFSIHELALNGAVTALLQQVRRLRARGDQVAILTQGDSGAAGALAPAFREIGADVVSQAVLAEFDVAVGCTIYAAPILAQFVGRIPTVWWLHEGQAGIAFVMGNAMAAQTMRQVNKIILPSRGVAEGIWRPILSQLPPGRLEIVPYLIPPPPPGEAAPRREGYARVLCVGSIYPRKRQSDLVRAVHALPGALECVLVGERVAPLEPPGEEILRLQPDRFTLTGGLQPDEVHRWYRATDIFSLPSGDECMPISPVEAAWHGVPVVLADLDCYQGIWRHGVNALIHPVGDVMLLAWYLRMLIETPALRARLTTAARATARQFIEQRAGALFDAVLSEVVAAPG